MPTVSDGNRPEGIEIFYESMGTGPSVLGAPGWMVPTPEVFSTFLPTAIEGRRLVTFHYRGSGSSPDVNSHDHSTRAYAADLSRVMDRERDVEQWDLIGIGGMGACTMMELAIAEPDRVRSVVLHQGWVRPDVSLRWQLEALAHVREHAGFLAYQQLAAALCFTPEYLDTFGDEVLARLWVSIKDLPETHLGFVRACLEHDVTGRLRSVKAPVLLVTGDKMDIMTGDRLLPALRDELPDAEVSVMKDAPHAFNETAESLAEFDGLVEGFWRKHTPLS